MGLGTFFLAMHHQIGEWSSYQYNHKCANLFPFIEKIPRACWLFVASFYNAAYQIFFPQVVSFHFHDIPKRASCKMAYGWCNSWQIPCSAAVSKLDRTFEKKGLGIRRWFTLWLICQALLLYAESTPSAVTVSPFKVGFKSRKEPMHWKSFGIGVMLVLFLDKKNADLYNRKTLWRNVTSDVIKIGLSCQWKAY